jgi:prepilin-type N-terminal cleavage/methylation domain-containing protein
MKRIENNKGFTIIEVVLVLAIAGLIFLMVFIALPALQAGQRDTARKSDASAVVAAVNSYISNNRGQFPDTDQKLKDQVDGGVSGNTTSITLGTDGSLTPTAVDSVVTVIKGVKCDSVGPDGKVTLLKGSARQYAVITQLEGSNKTGYCLAG